MLLLIAVQSKQPIGIFDSGIGGLTVAKAINKLLPNESFVYFGDTANMPYGEKPSQDIAHYTQAIALFLLQHNCKMVVIACNTASSAGYEAALTHFENKDLLVDVIQPISQHVANTYAKANIGVIATRKTVSDKAYSESIKKYSQSINVSELATPLLANMIEEGFYNNKIDSALINGYLEDEKLNNIDALVLGCTHYPLIEDEIKAYYNSVNRAVDVIDGSEVIAQKVKKVLQQNNLENTETGTAQYKFYVSELTPSFQQTASFLFNEALNLEHYPMW